MKIENIALSLTLIALGTESLAQQTKQPNILWLTFEDTSPHFIGCYGNEMARTPVMDSLAKNGVRFTNAYSTGTVSSPSRFCLITGCRPGRYGTGNHRSNYEIPEFVHGFPEYLYDLVADKWETNNLAIHPEYQKKVRELRNVLKKHLIETKDANFLPEYTLSMQQDEMIPYYLRLDKTVYPVEEVIETAMLCGLGVDVVEEQIQKVCFQNPIVSYWASIGLFSQRMNLKPYINHLKELLPKLNYSPARVWFAAAILNVEEDKLARRIMREGLLSPNNHIAIYALNTLVEKDLNRAKTFIPQLREAEAMYGDNAKRPGTESMMLVARLRLEKKDFRFSSFW